LLSVANAGRDVRRRATGYDILSAGRGLQSGEKISYVVEMDGLLALIKQEWTVFHKFEPVGDKVRACVTSLWLQFLYLNGWSVPQAGWILPVSVY
jgi:hypothetical protein